jgi:hypothetical protein
VTTYRGRKLQDERIDFVPERAPKPTVRPLRGPRLAWAAGSSPGARIEVPLAAEWVVPAPVTAD